MAEAANEGCSTVTQMTTETSAPRTPGTKRTDGLSRGLAYILAAAVAVPVPGHTVFSIGATIALPLLPALLPATWHTSVLRRVLIAGAVALMTSPFLIYLTLEQRNGRSFDSRESLARILFLANVLVASIALVWCAERLNCYRAIAIYCAASITASVTGLLVTTANDNPWKYVYAWPVTVLVLVLLRNWPVMVVCIAIPTFLTLCLIYGYRSHAGFLLIATVVAIASSRRSIARMTRRRTATTLMLVAIVTICVYQGVSWAAGNGYLGQTLQQHAYAATSGRSSGIVASRPEFAAATKLITENPLGLGPGIIPSEGDRALGRSAILAINPYTSQQYLDDYLFAGALEVHSLLGDLWLLFGIAGAALCLFAGYTVLRALAVVTYIENMSLRILVIFIATQSLWDIFFSPFYSAAPRLIIGATMLSLVARKIARQENEYADVGLGSRGRRTTAALSL